MNWNRGIRVTYVLTGVIAGLLIAGAIMPGTLCLASNSNDVHAANASNAANDHWKVIYVNRPGNLSSKIQGIPSSCRIEITPPATTITTSPMHLLSNGLPLPATERLAEDVPPRNQPKGLIHRYAAGRHEVRSAAAPLRTRHMFRQAALDTGLGPKPPWCHSERPQWSGGSYSYAPRHAIPHR